MCRSSAESFLGIAGHPRERDRLKIRAFYLRVSVTGRRRQFPDALTLVYLPRIDGNLLEVNGSRIRAEASAIVPLHRILSAEPPRSCGAEAVFASTDRVRAGEGVRFEAYVGEEKILRGVFRRGGTAGGWEMELKSAADEEVGVAAADLWVVGEKGVSIRKRVEVGRQRPWRRTRFCLRLEEIPEEREGCDCLCCEGGEEEEEEDEQEDGWEMVGSGGCELKQGGGKETEAGDVELDLDMDGVTWAVDVGLWVMWLGVGLLVSRASYKSLKRKLL